MSANIKEEQISHWLNKCKQNIEYFKQHHNRITDNNKKEFVLNQYRLVNIINNVLTGKTKLVGIDRNKFKN